jgi:ubiquinone biosynthesis monooxygenase Coq7
MVLDGLIAGVDRMLRVTAGVASATRPNPSSSVWEGDLDAAQRRHSAGLMRVNHVGEVCAQALYEAQGHFARDEKVRRQMAQAGIEEEDHLAWTAGRLRELDSRPSLLNPFWYAGSYILGATVASLGGDARSLGFVVETERQVEAHLAGHLDTLPPEDAKSRAIVEQMRADEAAHGAGADALGAVHPPMPVRVAMKVMAKVMTSTAYYL